MRTRNDSIIIVVFCLAISLPLIGMILKLDLQESLEENRVLAKLPAFVLYPAVLQKYPQDFTRYFNDHFGFRGTLVRTNFLFQYKLLGVSPSNKVRIGKDGWLFYASDNQMEGYRSVDDINDARLKEMAYDYESKRQLLANRGIKYLFVVAPNKSSIYSEYLPAVFDNVNSKSRIDKFIRYMRSNTQVEVLDLRNTLLEHKPEEILYLKTDSHWNDYGALLAYQAIIHEIISWFPGDRAYSIADFKVIKKVGHGGDLALMMGGAAVIREEYPSLIPLEPRTAIQIGVDKNVRGSVTFIKQNQKLPRALVFRDSFFDALIPFTSEHFKFSKYYNDRWSMLTPITALIESNQPNVVIEEVVERQIY